MCTFSQTRKMSNVTGKKTPSHQSTFRKEYKWNRSPQECYKFLFSWLHIWSTLWSSINYFLSTKWGPVTMILSRASVPYLNINQPFSKVKTVSRKAIGSSVITFHHWQLSAHDGHTSSPNLSDSAHSLHFHHDVFSDPLPSCCSLILFRWASIKRSILTAPFVQICWTLRPSIVVKGVPCHKARAWRLEGV